MVLFLFQAEDGIRVWSVTGVQTCALPISKWGLSPAQSLQIGSLQGLRRAQAPLGIIFELAGLLAVRRSEERRVGKECISRLNRDHRKQAEGQGHHARARNTERRHHCTSPR